MTFTTIEKNISLLPKCSHCVFLKMKHFFCKQTPHSQNDLNEITRHVCKLSHKLIYFIFLLTKSTIILLSIRNNFLCAYIATSPQNVLLFLLPPFLVIVCFTNVFLHSASLSFSALLSLLTVWKIFIFLQKCAMTSFFSFLTVCIGRTKIQ